MALTARPPTWCALRPHLAALRAGRTLALANKESLVAGGPYCGSPSCIGGRAAGGSWSVGTPTRMRNRTEAVVCTRRVEPALLGGLVTVGLALSPVSL